MTLVQSKSHSVACLALASLAVALVTALPTVAAAAAPGATRLAQAGTPATRKAAPAGAVPADVRSRVVAKLPGATPNDVAASPVPGLYEVTMGGVIVYVSEDGRHLVSGNVYDLETQVNLTAGRRSAARAKALAAASESQMIVFGPPSAKMTVTVFTDIDCGFCRRFHNQIAEVNKAGVRVRYMMFPRTGPGTESWKKAEQVWCSADRRDALTRAKRGEDLKARPCGDGPVKAQYELGSDLGVEGTPAIFTQYGDYVGGYMTPDELVQAVQDSGKAAAAAR